VLHGYRRWIEQHTELTSSSVALLRLPPDPALPEPIRGRFVVHVRIAHTGDTAEGTRLAHLMRGVAPVLLESLGELPLTALDLVHQDPPGPLPSHERGCPLTKLSAATVDAVLDQVNRPGSPLVLAEIRHLGGAINRPRLATGSAPGRTSAFMLFAIAPDIPSLAQASPQAVQDLLDAVAPWRAEANLPNFLGRACDPASVTAAWPANDQARLLAIKRRWDPANLFRLGHALLPAPHQPVCRFTTSR
jgi:hypothetical protein